MSHAVARGLADAMLQDLWAGRETAAFALPRHAQAVEPGDICDVTVRGETQTLMVTRIEDGAARRIEARSIEPAILSPTPDAPRVLPPRRTTPASPPEVMFLDLPLLTGGEPPYAPRVAAFARPWPGAVAIALGDGGGGVHAAAGDRAGRRDGRTDRAARTGPALALRPGQPDRRSGSMAGRSPACRSSPCSTAAMSRRWEVRRPGSR